MLVVERSILHHWVDIDDTGILWDDKLLLPGVFSGQSYCFCFLVVSGLDHQPVRVDDFVVEEYALGILMRELPCQMMREDVLLALNEDIVMSRSTDDDDDESRDINNHIS